MKQVKTGDALGAFLLMKSAKTSKVESNDERFKIIDAVLNLKTIATEWEEFEKTVRESCKDDDFAAMSERMERYQSLAPDERVKAFTASEIDELAKYNAEYGSRCNAMLEKKAVEVREIEIEPVEKKAFGQFIASNDWSIESICLLKELLM